MQLYSTFAFRSVLGTPCFPFDIVRISNRYSGTRAIIRYRLLKLHTERSESASTTSASALALALAASGSQVREPCSELFGRHSEVFDRTFRPSRTDVCVKNLIRWN